VIRKKESIVQYLKQYQKEFRSSLSKKTEVCLRKSKKSVGERENELCSNGNREYLDDKTTIAAMHAEFYVSV
jgi:hypothetical protein